MPTSCGRPRRPHAYPDLVVRVARDIAPTSTTSQPAVKDEIIERTAHGIGSVGPLLPIEQTPPAGEGRPVAQPGAQRFSRLLERFPVHDDVTYRPHGDHGRACHVLELSWGGRSYNRRIFGIGLWHQRFKAGEILPRDSAAYCDIMHKR